MRNLKVNLNGFDTEAVGEAKGKKRTAKTQL